ncbi:hypothetical protein A2U01_0061707, partial [Trifolium medium]|nr:hypothetical protein [Trifolium medium]
WRPLVPAQHLRVTTSNAFHSMILLSRIPCSSYSPQVHPLRTAASEEFRDTRRPNSTNALGFNYSSH